MDDDGDFGVVLLLAAYGVAMFAVGFVVGWAL